MPRVEPEASVDAFLEAIHGMAERLGRPVSCPGTLLGVTRLAFPGLMVELEATAVD
jgi:hypothetical protein